MSDGKRYLFYDIVTGEIIVNEARSRLEIMPTIERVIEIYPKLHDRARDSFDVLVLPYDAYSQDFIESTSYRVNPETKEIEFSYPDPNVPEEPQPYQKPLSEEVQELKSKTQMQDAAMEELMFIILPELAGGEI